MTIIAKLQALDQNLMPEKIKVSVQNALKEYPQAEGLKDFEVEALEKIYNKASQAVEKEQKRLKDEADKQAKAEQDEAARIAAENDLNSNYEAAISAGNASLESGDLSVARDHYVQASELKPDEQLPKDQIVVCDQKIEEARIAEENRLAEEEKNRIAEENRLAEENKKKGLVLPHVELYEKHKADLPPEFKNKLTGVKLLHSKFLKTPTESNQKAVVKSSNSLCMQINDFLERKKLAAEKTDKDAKAKADREAKEKADREAKELTEKQEKEKKDEADRIAAEEQAKKDEEERLRIEKEEKDRRGVFEDESFKGILGS